MKEFNIVIVDDDTGVLNLYKDIFTSLEEKYQIKYFTNPLGAEGAEGAINEKTKLLITDFDFGIIGINGEILIKQSREKYPELKAVMITGSSFIPQVSCMRIKKPIHDMDALQKAVQDYIA